jgi:DnaK suppressor protein
MAAKKTTSKTAAKKTGKTPASKPAKGAPAEAKKAAPADKGGAAGKSTPKKIAGGKVAPAAKPAPAPKATSATDLKATKEQAAKKPVLAPKNPVVAKKSSVVDFPAPLPPSKPPFVPPAKKEEHKEEANGHSGNGTHSKSFIEKQRQRLLDLRDELVDAMSGMTRDTIRNAPEGSEASGSGMHQGDAGSDAYDRDFALSVLAKEQDALYEIEQALRRIQKGTYGICEMSSKKIPQARLEVIPFARLTVECQAQWEKEYGNRRFRPSNEVGFSGGNYADDEDSDSVSLDEDED